MSPKLKPETLKKRKAQILKAAAACFAREGYHQTTMDDIVREAGLSKGGVYWHFKSKKELFLALFESLLSETEAMMVNAAAEQTDVKEKLRAVLVAAAALFSSDEFREYSPLLIDVWLQNRHDPQVNQLTVRMYEGLRRPLIELIEAGITLGQFRPVDVSALVAILLALCDGLMVQEMIDGITVDWEAVSETLLQILDAGLHIGPGEAQLPSISGRRARR